MIKEKPSLRQMTLLTITLTVLLFFLSIAGAATVSAGGGVASTLLKPINHSIEWTFNVYAAPDLKSKVVGSYPPKTVFVYEWLDGDWALIHTAKGAYWAYLKENKIYIDEYIPIYNNKGDIESVGNIDAQVVSVIMQEGEWLLIETWKGAKWINTGYAKKSVLMDIPSYNQRSMGYPTGCEIVSVAMMINYSAFADIETLVEEMPYSENPMEGFRGDPATKEGFTIYPNALLRLTEKYLGSAEDMSGCEIEDLQKKLRKNTPVVAWVSGLGFNVHAICLTGYDEAGLYYNDPWTGSKNSYISNEDFYKIWNKPIYDKVYGSSFPTRKALSYIP